MRFGTIPIDEAEGAILAHSADAGGRRLRKAHVLTAADIADLKAAGMAEVVAAVLAPDDMDENRAAEAVAAAMVTRNVEAKPPATGRVNLHAWDAGVLTVDAALIEAVNAVDPAITFATLAPHTAVEKGQMVATVKIIPFAVDAARVREVHDLCVSHEILAVHPFRAMCVGLIQTVLPGIKESVLDKTARVTAARLERSGSRISRELRTAHHQDAVAEAVRILLDGNDMVVIFGASALCDFDDVIPAAIRVAGGNVICAGMPVDPGNLLVLGRIGDKPVIGAPGCARSPKENGFDWVLDRVVAGLDVTSRDIATMGVGGLLMEIPSRPQPREQPAKPGRPKVYAVLLAAGRSSRMGGPNKLLALFEGRPLVRRTAERVLASRAAGTVAVTGHQGDHIAEALTGLDVGIARNADFASGLASSLKTGIAALPKDAAGAIIVLGDMPGVTSTDLDRLIQAFEAAGGRSVVRAVHGGRRGNPVILPRSMFSDIAKLEGDTGARHLVESAAAEIIDVEIGEAAALDVDTRDALLEAGGILQE